jgi:hypothetical protein
MLMKLTAPLDPTIQDLDQEVIDNLVNILARKWGDEDVSFYVQTAAAYAAMRQAQMLDHVAIKLLDIEVTLGALDDIRAQFAEALGWAALDDGGESDG